MRKALAVILAVAILLIPVSPTLAGGDKNRGDKAAGPAVQSHKSWCGYECRP